MLDFTHTEKYKALAVQLIEVGDSVVLKRGCVEIHVEGGRALEVLRILLTSAASTEGASCNEITVMFAAPDRPTIESLFKKLVTDRFLVPLNLASTWTQEGVETGHSVFYWNWDATYESICRSLKSRQITIIGINHIAYRLCEMLASSGFRSCNVVNYPPLRNVSYFSSSGEFVQSRWIDTTKQVLDFDNWKSAFDSSAHDCIVAASDFGGLHLMREWNEFCVECGIQFLPVVLQDMIGYVGPLVVPGEVACFECFRHRQNANMIDPNLKRAPEYVAQNGKSIAGYHPAMPAILADIAAMELTKFYSGAIPPNIAGTVIEVNLLAPSVVTRKILKIPRCIVCSSLLQRSPVTLERDVFHPAVRGL